MEELLETEELVALTGKKEPEVIIIKADQLLVINQEAVAETEEFPEAETAVSVNHIAKKAVEGVVVLERAILVLRAVLTL
jgi:hypothetical protein